MRNAVLFFMALISTGLLSAQTKTISGVVKDNSGKPISSATIQVKKTGAGTIADSAGSFAVNVSADDILLVSRVGYADTSIAVGNSNMLTIVMRYNANSLDDVSVKSKVYTDPEKTGAVNSTVTDQKVANGLEDFKNSANINVTPAVINVPGATSSSEEKHFYTSAPPTSRLYFGSGVPSFSAPKETKGTRYLFADWVKGVAVSENGGVMNMGDLWFNYDKIGKQLLVTADRKLLVEVDKSNLQSFSLKGPDGDDFVFEKVNALNPGFFYQALVKADGKYSFYKLLSTKFVKSDYHSDGLVETGTPYDEYVDSYDYFIVMPDGKTVQKLGDFKSKTLKATLPNDAAKVDSYFSQHKGETVNEVFVTGLVAYLNQ